MHEEIEKLRGGFNPFNKPKQEKNLQADKKRGLQTDKKTGLDDTQELLFVAGLKYALANVAVAPRTKQDLEYTVKLTGKAISKLNLGHIPIAQVSRKHIKNILKQISSTSDRFNKYRSYLMILFSELCEDEIVDVNPLIYPQ